MSSSDELNDALGRNGGESVAPTLLESLSDPASYPSPRPERVSVRTTHGSWVFLTGTDVYKVKRPVDYGFMNFSTVARRRHYCAEEVRVNRLLAPDVYLGVVPVRRDHRGYSIGRGGEVVDWAVHMRQLPASRCATRLLSLKRLGFEQLEALAAKLARFYRRAPLTSEGFVGRLRLNVEENFRQVEPFQGWLVEPSRLRRVRQRQREFLDRRRGWLERRGRGGFIREGHGDLRLEHVYFEDDEPVVIDAIEFNERFRKGDVALDAAFLAMDLEYRRRPELAAWFMSQMAMRTNDYDLFRGLDFYESYRAWVRGKVACFVASDPNTPRAKARRKAKEARAHFQLADVLLRPRHQPQVVVVVGGGLATGKSTLAATVAREHRMVVIGSDATRKGLAGLDPTERGDDAIYTPSMNRRTYDAMEGSARAVLESGRSVVMDATFRTADWPASGDGPGATPGSLVADGGDSLRSGTDPPEVAEPRVGSLDLGCPGAASGYRPNPLVRGDRARAEDGRRYEPWDRRTRVEGWRLDRRAKRRSRAGVLNRRNPHRVVKKPTGTPRLPPLGSTGERRKPPPGTARGADHVHDRQTPGPRARWHRGCCRSR